MSMLSHSARLTLGKPHLLRVRRMGRPVDWRIAEG